MPKSSKSAFRPLRPTKPTLKQDQVNPSSSTGDGKVVLPPTPSTSPTPKTTKLASSQELFLPDLEQREEELAQTGGKKRDRQDEDDDEGEDDGAVGEQVVQAAVEQLNQTQSKPLKSYGTSRPPKPFKQVKKPSKEKTRSSSGVEYNGTTTEEDSDHTPQPAKARPSKSKSKSNSKSPQPNKKSKITKPKALTSTSKSKSKSKTKAQVQVEAAYDPNAWEIKAVVDGEDSNEVPEVWVDKLETGSIGTTLETFQVSGNDIDVDDVVEVFSPKGNENGPRWLLKVLEIRQVTIEEVTAENEPARPADQKGMKITFFKSHWLYARSHLAAERPHDTRFKDEQLDAMGDMEYILTNHPEWLRVGEIASELPIPVYHFDDSRNDDKALVPFSGGAQSCSYFFESDEKKDGDDDSAIYLRTIVNGNVKNDPYTFEFNLPDATATDDKKDDPSSSAAGSSTETGLRKSTRESKKTPKAQSNKTLTKPVVHPLEFKRHLDDQVYSPTKVQIFVKGRGKQFGGFMELEHAKFLVEAGKLDQTESTWSARGLNKSEAKDDLSEIHFLQPVRGGAHGLIGNIVLVHQANKLFDQWVKQAQDPVNWTKQVEKLVEDYKVYEEKVDQFREESMEAAFEKGQKINWTWRGAGGSEAGDSQESDE